MFIDRLSIWSPVCEAVFASEFKEKNLSYEIFFPGKQVSEMKELLPTDYLSNNMWKSVENCSESKSLLPSQAR